MTKDPYQRRVKDVMSRDVVHVGFADSLKEALELMVENRVSALPVIDSRQRCAGVLSATDLLGLTKELEDDLSDFGRGSEASQQWLIDQLATHDMDGRTVGELMTESVASVGPDVPLADATREMLRHRVHRLPVVDREKRLLGIVSTMDILGAFVEGASNT